MSRLIDADALKEAIRFIVDNNSDLLTSSVVRGVMIKLVDRMSTIDAEPVRRGRWISIDEDSRGYAEEFECSSCGRETVMPFYMIECDYEYCPQCGAKMDGGENNAAD